MSAGIFRARTPAEIFLTEAFQTTKSRLPGGRDIAEFREGSFAAFEASGLPHRRMESWHYTDLRALMREAFPLATAPGDAECGALRRELAASRMPKQRLVFADGFLLPELSGDFPSGLRVRSLSSVLADGPADLIALLATNDLAEPDPMASLNAALMQDGVVIEIAPATKVSEPIHFIHAMASPEPAASFGRSLVVVGAGASVHIAESRYAGNNACPARAGQINSCLIFAANDESTLSHTVALTGNAPRHFHVQTVMARLGREARFESFALVAGIGLVRHQVFVRLEGAGSQAFANGASLVRGREHADTTLRIEHAAQATVSRESFRYILDEEATGVFQGRINVSPGAQKADGKMLCKSILLSELAAMNNKPELEIFADDVACGHGATCGGLDAEQLFYLQTKGLPFAQAEALLLEGFAGELADQIAHKGLAKAFRQDISAWLSARHSAQARLHPITTNV